MPGGNEHQYDRGGLTMRSLPAASHDNRGNFRHVDLNTNLQLRAPGTDVTSRCPAQEFLTPYRVVESCRVDFMTPVLLYS